MLALTVFIFVSLIGVCWALQNDRNVFQAPSLVGFACLCYIVPQAWILLDNRSEQFGTHVEFFLYYASGCIVALYIGFWTYAPRTASRPMIASPERLETIGCLLTVAGLIGVLGLRAIYLFRPDLVSARQWTGLPVYVYTLSKFVVPGMTLLVLATKYGLRFRGKLLLAASLAVVLYFTLFMGRRQWMFFLAFGTCMPLILQGRLRLGRKALTCGALLAPIVFLFLPAYRGHMLSNNHLKLLEALTQRPPGEILEKYLSGEQTIELEGAIMLTAAAKRRGLYSWGGEIYNGFVNKYVPGGIIGHELKRKMYATVPFRTKTVLREFGSDSVIPNYTGKPSFYDAFTNFSYAGVILYLLLGRIFASYSHLAFNNNDFRGVLFIALIGFLPPGLVYGAWEFIIPIFLPVIVFFIVIERYATTHPRYFLWITNEPAGLSRATFRHG